MCMLEFVDGDLPVLGGIYLYMNVSVAMT